MIYIYTVCIYMCEYIYVYLYCVSPFVYIYIYHLFWGIPIYGKPLCVGIDDLPIEKSGPSSSLGR